MQKSTLHSESADDIMGSGTSVCAQTSTILTFFIIYNVIIQEDEQQCKRKSKNLS